MLPFGHPAHPASPLSEWSYEYSQSLRDGQLGLALRRELGELMADGRSTPRHEHTRQPKPQWVQDAIAKIRGRETVRREQQALSYSVDEYHQCHRCGSECLRIDVLTGDTLEQRSMCECHLPQELQVRGREIRAAAEAQKAREDAKDAENLRLGQIRKRLLVLAQTCASGHLRLHNRCVDSLQDHPECAVCTLRTKKATKNRERGKKNAPSK